MIKDDRVITLQIYEVILFDLEIDSDLPFKILEVIIGFKMQIPRTDSCSPA